MKPELRIAVLAKDFVWAGGIELLRTITNSLLAVQAGYSLKVFLLLPVENRIDTGRDILWNIGRSVWGVVKYKKWVSLKMTPGFDTSLPDYFENIDESIEIIEYNRGIGLIPALKRIRADVVIPASSSLGTDFPVPWVGYICDFQHKYLTDYFGVEEIKERDLRFHTVLDDAKAVIVNSEAVRRDIDKFYPAHKSKVFKLPFSGAPLQSWLEADVHGTRMRYELPKRYLLISNQFWIHKAHDTAFRALKLLVEERTYRDLHIVCTGKLEDYRFPEYIQTLQREIDDLGISQKVVFLGHIPKIDQISIMRGALAVLQPTMFEGGPGGGAVFDAVALSVPAILSDIAINKEIEAEESVFYFRVGSAQSLAETIKEVLRDGFEPASDETLMQKGNCRKQLLGEQLLEVMEYVIQHKS